MFICTHTPVDSNSDMDSDLITPGWNLCFRFWSFRRHHGLLQHFAEQSHWRGLAGGSPSGWSAYLLAIKHGNGNPLWTEVLIGKSLMDGPFSSTPCLMKPEGMFGISSQIFWLVLWNMDFTASIRLGISLSRPTQIFQRGWNQQPLFVCFCVFANC